MLRKTPVFAGKKHFVNGKVPHTHIHKLPFCAEVCTIIEGVTQGLCIQDVSPPWVFWVSFPTHHLSEPISLFIIPTNLTRVSGTIRML